MPSLRFTIAHRSDECHARVGRVETLHGGFDTPAFMPVGTAGAMKGLTPEQMRGTGTQILLNNAYHLMLRPGADLVDRRGGVHAFMRWDGPILTDSGGYQAFSMADISSIDDDGVTFKSIVDGSRVHLTPERSIEVQNDLGADIIMAFDDCPPGRDPASAGERDAAADAARLRVAHERTVRWVQRCRRAHRRPDEQALFGIVQGGTDLDLRRESVEAVCAVDLPGYAIGGVAVGEGPELMAAVVEHTAPLLPADRPRYLMGVGYERDLLTAIRAGVDMFDCVLPTRNGRNAQAFTRSGRLHLRNARFTEDDGVLDPECDCEVCRGGFTRAYVRHLFMAREMLGPILVSMHNIRHFQALMVDIRRAIRENAWSALLGSWPVLASDLSPPAARDVPASHQGRE
ncbi:MAG: tRNA guanosine(34) transglycosylase Tgt [Planctomycetes bacterium]|nr:tRNA guanosine(34) transglycosylase Tgt [Planctomycetota bacterium]